MITQKQEAEKKAKKSSKVLVKTLSNLKQHDAILFKLKDTYSEIKQGKINSKSELAQPLEAHVVSIENNVVHAITRDGSHFDLTLKDYVIIKKLKSEKYVAKKDADADAKTEENVNINIDAEINSEGGE